MKPEVEQTPIRVGEIIEARWTWEGNKYFAHAIVEKLNPGSVRISLNESVRASERRYYPKRHALVLSKDEVRPIEGRSEADRQLQIAAYTDGLSDKQKNYIIEQVAAAWDEPAQKVIEWIAEVNSHNGKTMDEEFWGYYELWCFTLKDCPELKESIKEDALAS